VRVRVRVRVREEFYACVVLV